MHPGALSAPGERTLAKEGRTDFVVQADATFRHPLAGSRQKVLRVTRRACSRA